MHVSRSNESNFIPPQKRLEGPPQVIVEIDPYLDQLSQALPEFKRKYLAQKTREIKVRYSVIADEIYEQEKNLHVRKFAVSDLASYEANLQYVDGLLETDEYKNDELLKLAKEIMWREHLYGIMVLNKAPVLEICKVANDKLKWVIIVSTESLRTACQWKNSTFEEGLTWLPVPARKTRLSLGVFAPAANGVPICTVVASSATARRLIATGEDIHPNPQASLGAQYTISEFESLNLRKTVLLKDRAATFAKGMARDNENLGEDMFISYKDYHDKTGRVPWLVSMQTVMGRLRELARSKWFWVALILTGIMLISIGQAAGWWDFPGFRNIFGKHIEVTNLLGVYSNVL